jgi:hypothetical protein
MDASDETSTLGVLMDIKDARSETSDIESEVPDDETSDSVEAMRCWNHCRWLVLWCSASSWSITVRIVGVGILLNNHAHHDDHEYTFSGAGFEHAEHLSACRTACKMHFVLIFKIFAFQSVHSSHFSRHF